MFHDSPRFLPACVPSVFNHLSVTISPTFHQFAILPPSFFHRPAIICLRLCCRKPHHRFHFSHRTLATLNDRGSCLRLLAGPSYCELSFRECWGPEHSSDAILCLVFTFLSYRAGNPLHVRRPFSTSTTIPPTIRQSVYARLCLAARPISSCFHGRIVTSRSCLPPYVRSHVCIILLSGLYTVLASTSILIQWLGGRQDRCSESRAT